MPAASPSERAPALPIVTQLRRYAITGVVSNVVLYGLYLALTGMGVRPELAMSIVYVVGVLQTFVVNRAWSFRHDGPAPGAFLRYSAMCVTGYVANLAILVVFADGLGWDHRFVQGAAILVVAALLFLLQRSWVFGSRGVVDARAL